MSRSHFYSPSIEWTGNRGEGTRSYSSYSRDHVIRSGARPEIPGSSDPAFRGDPTRHNPEDLLIASLSACHMLWYLHLCATAGIVVVQYADHPEGTMVEEAGGGGKFTEAVLRPRVVISSGDRDRALALHHEAHEKCFIASSVSFPLRFEADVQLA